MKATIHRTDWHDNFAPAILPAFDCGDEYRRAVTQLESGVAEFWTLARDGRPVGYLATVGEVIDGKRELVILALVGHGVAASDFMQLLEFIAAQSDMDSLRCEPLSRAHRRLYERLGFENESGILYKGVTNGRQ